MIQTARLSLKAHEMFFSFFFSFIDSIYSGSNYEPGIRFKLTGFRFAGNTVQVQLRSQQDLCTGLLGAA